MQIVDEYIYYTPDTWLSEEEINDEVAHLYRCNIDGSNVVEIIDKPTYCWFVFDNAILYQDDRDNMSLYICNLDGSNRIKLNDDYSYCPIYDGEYIYYSKDVERDDMATIWKIKPDGTNDSQVADYPVVSDFCLKDGYLYFSYIDDEKRLYRMKTDGSDLSLISQDKNTSHVHFIGDRLVYRVYAENYEYIDKIVMSNADGSDGDNWEFNK